MLEVFTARISTRDPDAFDITRKSGNFAFAPSWALLRPYLDKRAAGHLTDADWLEYVERYTAEMRESYRTKSDVWNDLLQRDRVVLTCMCVDSTRCHRTVMARDILPRLGATYRGELPEEPKAVDLFGGHHG